MNDFEKHFRQGYSEQNKIPALTNWGKNYPAQYLVGKNVAKQHGCRDRFDQSGTSVRLISCWKTPQNAGNS